MRFPALAASAQEEALLAVTRLVNKNIPKKPQGNSLAVLSGVAEARKDPRNAFGAQMADRLGQAPRVSNQSAALRNQKSDDPRHERLQELKSKYSGILDYISLLNETMARVSKDLEKKREDRYEQERKNLLRKKQDEGEKKSRENAAVTRGSLELSQEKAAFAASPIASAMQTEKRLQFSLSGDTGRILEPTYTRVPGMDSLIASAMGPEVPPELRTQQRNAAPAPAAPVSPVSPAPMPRAVPQSPVSPEPSQTFRAVPAAQAYPVSPVSVSRAVPQSPVSPAAPSPAFRAAPAGPVSPVPPPQPEAPRNDYGNEPMPYPEDEDIPPVEDSFPETQIVSFAQDGDDETDISNSMVFTDVDLNIQQGGGSSSYIQAPEPAADEVSFSGEPVTSHRHYLRDVQDSFTQDIMHADLQEAERAVIIFAVRLPDSTPERWHLAWPDSYELLVKGDIVDNMNREFSAALGHKVEITADFGSGADFSGCPDALARAYCRNMYASEKEALLRSPVFQELARELELNLQGAQFYLEDRNKTSGGKS
ncbi:hypothetical protein [Succinimonas sp.]|uniref:hypothetical protein n=1 Tax=Succinimonas sp. TaxID=1936151 RepID=UPI0038680301